MATVEDFQIIMRIKIDGLADKIADMMLSEEPDVSAKPFNVVELSAQKEVFEGAVKLSGTLSRLAYSDDDAIFTVLKNITHQALILAEEEMDKTDITSDQRLSAVGAHAGYSEVISQVEAIGF